MNPKHHCFNVTLHRHTHTVLDHFLNMCCTGKVNIPSKMVKCPSGHTGVRCTPNACVLSHFLSFSLPPSCLHFSLPPFFPPHLHATISCKASWRTVMLAANRSELSMVFPCSPSCFLTAIMSGMALHAGHLWERGVPQ